MHIPPHYDDAARPGYLKQRLANEVSRVIADLDVRRQVLHDLYSQHRDRGPFIDSVLDTWQELSAEDLLLLDAEAVVLLEAFFANINEFRLYVTYTEDMPTTLISRYDRTVARLKVIGEAIYAILEVEPERPTLEDLTVDPEVLKFFTPQWPDTPKPAPEPQGEIVITGEET